VSKATKHQAVETATEYPLNNSVRWRTFVSACWWNRLGDWMQRLADVGRNPCAGTHYAC